MAVGRTKWFSKLPLRSVKHNKCLMLWVFLFAQFLLRAMELYLKMGVTTNATAHKFVNNPVEMVVAKCALKLSLAMESHIVVACLKRGR